MTTVAGSLWQDYRSKGDPMARARLLERHLGLVHHVARQLGERFPSEIETDDLVSAGTLGLVRALESFDPSRGLEFSTYAIPRIRGSILDDLRDRDWVPRSVRAKARQVHGAVSKLESLLGRAPTPQEIAHVLELDMPTYWRWRREIDGTVPVSFDGPIAPDRHDAPSLEETLTDPTAPRASWHRRYWRVSLCFPRTFPWVPKSCVVESFSLTWPSHRSRDSA